MQLSDTAIREFQALYLAQLGIQLTKEEARNTASEVIAFLKFVNRVD